MVIEPGTNPVGVGVVDVLYQRQICCIHGFVLLVVEQIGFGQDGMGFGASRIELDRLLGARQCLCFVARVYIGASQNSHGIRTCRIQLHGSLSVYQSLRRLII